VKRSEVDRPRLCREDGLLGGICEALATNVGLNPNGVRLLMVVGFFCAAPLVIPGYILAWVLLPKREDVEPDLTTALDFKNPEGALQKLSADFEELQKRCDAIENITASHHFQLNVEYHRKMMGPQ
jgi:phage shock protein PspC (stress-responsive transcriptional regulator)